MRTVQLHFNKKAISSAAAWGVIAKKHGNTGWNQCLHIDTVPIRARASRGRSSDEKLLNGLPVAWRKTGAGGFLAG